MKDVEQATDGNDFPVARALNRAILTIADVLREPETLDFPVECDTTELNRCYVLLAHELEKLYGKNSELAAAKPEPFWKRYDILKTFSGDILNYLDEPDNEMGQAHILRLDRLCIIANNETPQLSPEQIKLIEDTAKAVKDYLDMIGDAETEEHERIDKLMDEISEYKLDYKPDGTIVINDTWKLKKTHIGSTIDKLLEQAFKNPNTLFTPNLGRTSRNLSTVLSSAGFTPELRELFFPIISKDKGVLFRPLVSVAQAEKDNIDTSTIDIIIKVLNAQ